MVQFSRSVTSDSLRPPEPQHARFPCPSPTLRAFSNSRSSSRWCHPTISSCHPLLLPPSIFPSIRVFSNESALCIRWPKYWSFSFSISPSNEYSRLISFRIDWLDLLTVQVTLKESSTPQFKSINSLAVTLLYGPTLTSAHDYKSNHSFNFSINPSNEYSGLISFRIDWLDLIAVQETSRVFSNTTCLS